MLKSVIVHNVEECYCT